MGDVSVLKPDSLAEAAEAIRKGVGSKHVVIIVGRCSVEYEGRGESKLTPGERIVIIKEDGAFIVHRPTGYAPVNWQPSTSAIRIDHDGDVLNVVAVRNSPREIVRVVFTDVKLVISCKLVDSGSFVMYLDEHEIRDILYEEPSIVGRGIRFVEKEKRLPVGSIDIFGYDENGVPVVVEIKRTTAGREAVLQLYRYVESYKKVYGVRPRGILVAPSISQKARESIDKLGLEFRPIDIQKLWRMKRGRKTATLGAEKSILDYLGGGSVGR